MDGGSHSPALPPLDRRNYNKVLCNYEKYYKIVLNNIKYYKIKNKRNAIKSNNLKLNQ